MTITAFGRIAAIAAAATLTMPVIALADPVPAKPAAPAASDSKLYCVVRDVTGSHLQQRTCKTREQWIRDDDFDPTKK